MRTTSIYSLLFLFISIFASSCSAVEGIFKAGMYWAFFLVFIVIAVIIWLFSRGKK